MITLNSKLTASTALLILAAATVLAPSVRAGTVTYTTGDLMLGFEQPGVSYDYVVDLGPATTYLNATGVIDVNSLLSSNFAADLSSSNLFGSGWATNGAQGTNVQWGVIGATSKLSGTFGLPANTLFLTQAEYTPGSGSTAPSESSGSSQGTVNNHIITFGSAFTNLTATANSPVGTIEPTSPTTSWTSNNPSVTAFGSVLNIEQPTSGTSVGPTNSELDLYELIPTTAGGTGQGKEIGTFQLSSGGTLTFTPAPEPSSLAAVTGGIFMLAIGRRRAGRRAA